jgi:HD-like signal output (HDOD) protein
VFSLIPKSTSGSFDVAMLWQDSLRRAMFSRFLLLEIKKGDPEMAFAGALLQDMAIPLLLKIKKNEYGNVLDKLLKSNNTRLSVLEREAFGWDHAEAAGLMGKGWKLPEPLISITEKHLDIEGTSKNFDSQPEEAVVALSAFLPVVSNPKWEERETFYKHFNSILLGKERVISTVFGKVDMEFEQYARIIQVAVPKVSLFSFVDV